MRRTIVFIFVLSVIAGSLAFAAPEFDRFQALIGVDDGCKGRSGEAIFRVKVDGKEVFKSDVMLPGETPKPVDVSIAGAKELALYIDDEGDGHGGDWGNWLDARLVNSKTGEILFLTDLTPEERAWIPSYRDRNIIENKLSVDGKTYARGWGGISGNEMVFRNWSKVAADKESAIDEINSNAARQLGKLTLKSSSPLPQGLKISVDGKPLTDAQLKSGVTITASSILTITTDPANKAHTDWWKSGKATISTNGTRKLSVSLVDIVQPTDRVIHKGTHHPNRSVLIGDASDEPQAYWLGQAYPPNGPITFNLRDIPLAVVRATASQVKSTGGQLIIKAKQYRTTEVPNPESVTSSVLTVTIDGNPVAYVLSDNQSTWNQAVQLTSWPKRLECVVSPGADGSLGDGFAIDLGIQLKDMKEPLWLRTVAPSYSKFNYKSAKLLLMTEAWQLPGAGLARWDNLEAELNARQAGIKALEAARPKIAAAKDKKTIDEAVSEVLKADPKQTEIRLVAAARFRELGDLAQERRQWGLLAEDSRADLSLIQQARLRIDAIWAEMDPEPFVYPDDHSPMRNVRALGRQWKGIGEFTNNIWTLVIDKEKSWADKLAFNAPDADKFAVMVNSLGIEVTARLTAGEKVVAERTSKQPLLIVDASEAGIKAGTPLELTVSIDPDITGILLTHTMEVAAWPVKSDADLPTEAWDVAVHKDGTATVSRTSKAPVLAAIPRTAMNLMIEGAAAYTIQEPITEYLVQWDGKLGGANIPLFAVPEPGKEMRITYHWPDAAYNVPMSKYSWDRHDHVYMSTPACLLDTDKKSVWRITEMPADWKVEEFTPKPVNDAAKPLVFNVEPAGGLSARWEAHDVLTSWICMNHGNIRFYVPDNPNNRRFFPVWMKYVRVIHDKQLKVSGHNRPYMLYIGPTGASMLSGYGGGTAGDDLSSETWIASTGRMAPCVWRHGDNVTGVDSHELHWVTLRCRVPGSPTWTDQGYGCWLEQIGWEATELANSEWWRRQRMKAITPALELIKASGKNPIQSEGPAWDALPGNDRELMIHLGWFICDEIYRTYGEGFWPKFWAAQWDLYADVYPILSDRAKQILFVDELVRISGDPKLRERFEKEWLFDLTPDPQDAPDRFLILPRDPRITTEDNLEFAKLDCDDRCWAASSGLGPWQEKVVGMKGYNGVAWYRFTFDVPKDFKDENLELVLGRINNCDECYLNGTKIGASGKFPPDWEDASRVDRVYKVPKGLLKPGQQNVLAVRVFGNIGSGAIYERPRLISRISD